MEKIQELAGSGLTQPEHRPIFQILYEHYKKCYETEPGEDEPSPSAVLDNIKSMSQPEKSQAPFQETSKPPEPLQQSYEELQEFYLPEPLALVSNKDNANDPSEGYINKELIHLNASKGKGMQTLIPEGGLEIMATQCKFIF